MEEYSFLKSLKIADIVKILEKNNLRLKLDVPQPLTRDKDEDGTDMIIAKCEHINKEGSEEDIIGSMGGALLRNLGYAGAMFGSFSKYSAYNGDEIIEIRDFYMTEILSMKAEEDAKEYVNKLTKSYHEYMTEKFGEVYAEKAEEFFEKLRAENEKTSAEDFQKDL